MLLDACEHVRGRAFAPRNAEPEAQLIPVGRVHTEFAFNPALREHIQNTAIRAFLLDMGRYVTAVRSPVVSLNFFSRLDLHLGHSTDSVR